MFTGKVALITGGASGIGLDYAKELLANGVAGVSLLDINEAAGRESAKQLNVQCGSEKVIFIRTDATKPEELEAGFQKTIDTFQKLDIVINNAGMLNDLKWETEIALNCASVVHGSLLGMKYMGKNNGGMGGVIVNIASILGLQECTGCPVYTGTKHFVVGLSRSFGMPYFWDLTGVKFLIMCPGVTQTPLIAEASGLTLPGFPGLGSVLRKDLEGVPTQNADNVARGLIKMLREGDNGSIWVAEGGEPAYEVELPDRTSIRKM